MAQLRAKQIKLGTAGDLLIGGTNGNGQILSIGSNNQVLKVVSGNLTYETQSASDVSVSAISGVIGTTVQQVLEELYGSIGSVDVRINDLNTSLGITGDSYTAITGSNYLDSTTSFRSADIALDSAIKAVADSISIIGNAFKYIGTLDPTTDSDLDTISDPQVGDYYKISASGTVTWNSGASSLVVSANDGIVYNSANGWDKIDNTNSTVTGGTNIDVSGSTDTGYTVSIDGIIGVSNGGTGVSTLGNISSLTNAITVSNGTGASIVDVDLTFNPENVDIVDLSGVLSISKGGTGLSSGGTANEQVLLWDNDNTQFVYSYLTKLKTSDGVDIATVVGTGATAKLTANVATADIDDDLVFATKGWVEGKIITAVAPTKFVETFDVVASGASTGEINEGANASITLTNTPIGSVVVSFNGLVLRTQAYSVTDDVVTLVDSVVGYSVEAGDVLTFSYEY